jgi:amino acid adenylation domain-containing protein
MNMADRRDSTPYTSYSHSKTQDGLSSQDFQAAEQVGPNDFWADYLCEATTTTLNFAPTTAVSSCRKLISIDLDEIAVVSGVGSSAIIYVAWALVLAQHTAINDVVFAVADSREESSSNGTETLSAPFSVVVPRRLKFTSRDTILSALRSADLESEQIRKHSWCGLQRALNAGGCSPHILDTLVNITRARSPGAHTTDSDKPCDRQAEYTVLRVEVCDGSIKLELNSHMEQIRLNFIMGQLVGAIGQITKEPERLIGTIRTMTPEEIDYLQQPHIFPSDPPENLLAGFYEFVRLKPDHVALQWQTQQSWNYKELDQKANRLANLLCFHGVKNQDRVCLLLKKSPMMIVSILAVLKTGATYVPMGPENPINRNVFIAQETEAILTISESSIEKSTIAAFSNVLVLDETSLPFFSSLRPDREIRSHDPAYIIYTSGSTGRPKGVLLSHGAAAAAIKSMVVFENRHEGEWRALQFSNYIFDASILDIFNTLSSGGTLCMAPNERLLSELMTVINEMKVTHSFFTPTVARLLDPAEVPTLRSLTVGGESLSIEVIRRWCTPGRRLIQAYGPTETAMVSSMRLMSPDSSPTNLGRFLPTARAFILDRDETLLVPYGAVGELCLGGPQLGQGYIKRPELAGKAFIEADRPIVGGLRRLYRSGDLARWLPDGEVEYIGRKDHQVKFHGYRIELGEIERAVIESGAFMKAQDVVAEVVLPLASPATPALAVFVLLGQPGGPESGDDGPAAAGVLLAPTASFRDAAVAAQARLRQVLAAYMVPELFIPVSRIPRSSSDKTDRPRLRDAAAALSRPELRLCRPAAIVAAGAAGMARRSPSTAVERVLAAVWAHVFGLSIDDIGADDDFFAVGGDSIAAMRLVSMARARGSGLTLHDVFRCRTLSQLALASRPVPVEGEDVSTVPFALLGLPDPEAFVRDRIAPAIHAAPGQVLDVLPCTAAQRWSLTVWPLCHLVISINGRVQADRLHGACQALVNKHSILRTVFTPADGNTWQVVLRDLDAPFYADNCDDGDASSLALALRHADEGKTTPLGTHLVQFNFRVRDDENSFLVITLSHAQYDGISVPGIYTDLADAYRGQALSPSLPFSAFIRCRLAQNQAAAYAFWRNYLEGASLLSFQSSSLSRLGTPNVKIGTPTLVKPFREIPLPVLPSGITMSTMTTAAWALVVSRITGRHDIVLCQVTHGRSLPLAGIDTVCGPCATGIPLRIMVPDAPSSRSTLAFLRHVQDQYIRTGPYAYVEWSDIRTHATSWGPASPTGSTFQYRGIPVDPDFVLDRGIRCTTMEVGGDLPVSARTENIDLVVRPVQDKLVVYLATTNRILQPEIADIVIDEFSDILGDLDAASDSTDLSVSKGESRMSFLVTSQKQN